MGILCHQCQWSNKEINDKSNAEDNSEEKTVILPKLQIYNINFSETSQREQNQPIIEINANEENKN